jgi:hypothetical protein
MADWYVSSVAYSAIPLWAASTAYTVGQIVRPITPSNSGGINNICTFAFRCTTAGTSGATEPNWGLATGDGSTVASGGATFTNVAGRSAHGWGAAAGSLYAISTNTGLNRPVPGDRVFMSSDHSESFNTVQMMFNNFTQSYGQISIISVNRAGSVPPVAADALPGASITTTAGSLTLDSFTSTYWQGISFILSAATTTGHRIAFGSSGSKAQYLKDCALICNRTSAADYVIACNTTQKVTWDNTTVQFGHIGQNIFWNSAVVDFTWINTAAPIQGAIIPTSLFSANGQYADYLNVFRGVNFSALNTSMYVNSTSWATCAKFLFESCRVSSSMSRTIGTTVGTVDEYEYINCFDGTNVINERHIAAGDVSIERATYMSGGASDGTGYSVKMVSNVNASKNIFPLESFWIDVGNTVVGSSKTATVEIISSGTLNSDDINLLLEYMGTAGTPLASFGTTLPPILTAGSALPTSTSTWTGAPATPVKQLLQVTFTPQVAGRVRGRVRLGKTSTTVYVNPQITIA